MGGQDRVVWLNHCCRHLGSRVDGKLQLGLLSIVNRETFHEQGGEPRTSTTTKAVENEESLESSALVSQLPDTVQDQVNNLLSDGVVTTSIVVGGILLASDELFRVEQLTVGATAHLICKNTE